MQEVGDPAERDHRPRQHHQVGVERHQIAHRDPTGNHLTAPKPEHEQRTQAHEEAHARVVHRLDTNQSPVAVDVLLVGDSEPLDLGRLLAVRPYHSHSGQHLLRHRADLRELLLDTFETPVNRSTEDGNRHRHERQRHQ